MREPNLTELARFITSIQPELDEQSARDLLMLDGVAAWVTARWHDQRVTADSLLGLHLELHTAMA